MNNNLVKKRLNFDNLLRAIKHPLLILDVDNNIICANDEAEMFFGISRNILNKYRLNSLYPSLTSIFYLIDRTKERGITIREYSLNITTPLDKKTHEVDVQVSLYDDGKYVLLMLIERGIAKKFNKQYLIAGSSKTLIEMSSILAHEIKNPLSGIKGAAQLLIDEASEEEKSLINIICDETDRINNLIDSMQIFSDNPDIKKEKLNIHTIFNHVKKITENGFAKNIKFIEKFDPSLPDVNGNKDLLIQAFLNLVKNSCDAISSNNIEGEITFTSAFTSSMAINLPTSKEKIKVPLTFTIEDNGGGIPDEILENIFDPFITNKVDGKGLGLTIVSKIIQDHGAVIECELTEKGTKMILQFPMKE
tara:strand:+ start:1337 stop:2425 length:1089 start_codon:yes stop_codon:yes gene_type:complete